ncbi:taste receptor type 2 member 60 [Nycticebus coucang]|uniref:taste receptor type 2 member 60 n=1 Tax=Nycticebus coucang TaxID=9470 RepID=UPI00234C0935|nr:taste receptor type 2 member 60 [Nycticebus coucang]
MSGDHTVPDPLMIYKKAVVCAIFLLFFFLVAVLGNGFITAVLGMEWLLRRTLLPCDKLLISLVASRFCLQWVLLCRNIYIFLHPTAFLYSPVLQFLAFQWDFLNAATLWFSTWLSVFYCVKIATFTHPIFLWLKRKLSGWVPWMLFSSVGLSSFNTILFFIGNQRIYQNYLRSSLLNVTRESIRSSCEKFYLFPLKMVTWTVPTAVFFICMTLLITSLGRHMKKSLLTISGFREPRTQAHIKALLTLISFAILFISYFLSLVLSAAGIIPSWALGFWVWHTVIYLCMAVHPIILLLSNSRLRAALQRGCFLRCGAPCIAAEEKSQGDSNADGVDTKRSNFPLCHV